MNIDTTNGEKNIYYGINSTTNLSLSWLHLLLLIQVDPQILYHHQGKCQDGSQVCCAGIWNEAMATIWMSENKKCLVLSVKIDYVN